MEDLLIQNISIIDGTGAKPASGSISVTGDRITHIFNDPYAKAEAKEIINGNGLTATPGFVDTHTHSDMTLLHDGGQDSSITQGVTCEIIGQDGLSYAPLSNGNLRSYARYLKGINGLFDDVPLDFSTVREYLEMFHGKTAVNVAYLVPHCALRLETVGFENKLLTRTQMEKAKCLLQEGLNEGAKGFSTGLSYFPGAFSDTQELIEFCKTVKEEDGVYVTHLRTVFQGKPFDKVEEALEIARQSGVKLHFSHYRTGGGTIGKSSLIMEKIDAAIQEGLDITLELYPYHYGASYAPMFVPVWANEGGMDDIMNRLSDHKKRSIIAEHININFSDFDGVITYAGKNPQYMGRTFSELAKERNITMGEVIAELLYSEELALSFHDVAPALDEDTERLFRKDIFDLLSRPCYMIGSDAIHVGKYPHPRAYGSFARLIRLAREEHFPMETLIQRITSLPCIRFKLKYRGYLKEGYFADIVLLDTKAVTDMATDNQPRLTAKGIHNVFVNGCMVVNNGSSTGKLPGRVL